MPDAGMDWGSIVSGVATGIPLGGIALKLAFDMIREKGERLKAQEESFVKKLDALHLHYSEVVKEVREAHARDLREIAEHGKQERAASERLLERVLEGVQQLALIRAQRGGGDDTAGAGGGGGGAPRLGAGSGPA